MKRLFKAFLKIMLFLTLMVTTCIIPSCSLIPHGVSGENMIGYWNGSLKIPTGEEIKIEFEIFTDADGDYGAFLLVPEQNENAILVNGLTFEKKVMRFSVTEANGVYEGTVTGGNRIEGEWRQSGQVLPLVFERVR